ncbi:hypothetical protein EMPS_08497 [Entomortierella parvispora]|uniref:F-box domain-containing protein n=1 Tax=Entomortierella parvispora TaxID=205924 RepID=A0A9P3HGH1_9FUNG|nr:hypothetical protein EMPS_08497 [Entomortierella parvispora]
MAPPLQDHPLFLPELLTIIASLLKDDKASIFSCLRTCKDFHHAFAPLIWKEVVLPLKTGRFYKSSRNVLPKSVLNYAPYISSLTFRDDAPDSYAFRSLTCPNLTKLELWASRGDVKRWIQKLSDAPESLVSSNRGTLQELNLSGFLFWSEDLQFWTTVRQVPGLKRLCVNNSYFCDKECMLAFWDVCTKESLEQLRLEQTKLATPVPDMKGLNKLQHVTIWKVTANTSKELTDFISNLLGSASGLATLKLMNVEEEEVFNDLKPVLQRSRHRWPMLTRLEMNASTNITDQDMDEIIRQLPLSLLTLTSPNLGPRSFRALVDTYASTLTHLNLCQYHQLSSLDIRRVFWECKNLVSLKSDLHYAVQISDVTTSSWVCENLEEWSLGILNDAPDPERASREIFHRLGSMTKLTSLQILSKAQQGQIPLLSPRIILGLDGLRPLKALKRFDFDGRKMAQRDWHWILKTFRQMETISCWIDRNDELQQKFLTELRRTYGVHIIEFLV